MWGPRRSSRQEFRDFDGQTRPEAEQAEVGARDVCSIEARRQRHRLWLQRRPAEE